VPITTPTYVQVAPDSTGAKILNHTRSLTKADGSEHTTALEVVLLASPTGSIVDPDPTRLLEQLTEMNEKLEQVVELLQIVAGADLRQAHTKAGSHRFLTTRRRDLLK
jgi:hypothetical protein